MLELVSAKHPERLDTKVVRCQSMSMAGSINALTLRQSLGRVLRQLAKGGAPIIVEQRGKPAAALISLDDYQKRFVDVEADEHRREVVSRIRALNFDVPRGTTTLDLLRQARGGS